MLFIGLFCCHGYVDAFVLKGGKIDDNSNFVVLAVGPKLTPMSYLMSFFEPSIRMLNVLNKNINHTLIAANESVVAPRIRYNASTQIPDPIAAKRIIRQANTADGLLNKTNIIKSPHIYNNTMNSIPGKFNTT